MLLKVPDGLRDVPAFISVVFTINDGQMVAKALGEGVAEDPPEGIVRVPEGSESVHLAGARSGRRMHRILK